MSSRRRSVLELSNAELVSAIVLFASILVGFVLVTRDASGASKPSIEIEQCANLDATCKWQKGNLGQSNALYFEGQSVPYRSVLSGLSTGQTYAVRIEWDTTENDKHAFDYLTSFDRTEPGADPCAIALCSGLRSKLGIPLDPNVSGAGVTQIGGQFFDLWGGTFTAAGSTVPNTGNLCGPASCTVTSNPSGYSLSGTYEGSSQTSVEVYFAATSPTAVLAWGGHIASRLDWGSGNSAVDLSGSPYHMRLTALRCSDFTNCSTGNMDLSLSTTAVVYPGQITIVKEADVETSDEFEFTASTPLEGFVLVDDGSESNKKVFDGITDFQEYFISELTSDGWDFDSVDCDLVVDRGGGYSVNGPDIVIDLAEGESIMCTFKNTQVVSTSSTTSTSTSTSTSTNAPTSTSTSTTSTSTSTSAPTSTSTSAPTSTSTSAPTSTSSTSTTASPPIVIVPAVPIRPAEVTTTPPSTTSAPTTTGEAVILPAEIPSDSTLPSTGSSTRTTSVLGLLLLAIGGLGLVLLAIRSTTTKERNS